VDVVCPRLVARGGEVQDRRELFHTMAAGFETENGVNADRVEGLPDDVPVGARSEAGETADESVHPVVPEQPDDSFQASKQVVSR